MITGWVALEDASLSEEEEEEEEKEHGMLEWEWEEKNLMELKSMNYPDLQHLYTATSLPSLRLPKTLS